MTSRNWTNKWVLTLLVGIIIQAIGYTMIWILQPPAFTSHSFFIEVIVICFASLIIQIIGFGVIMSKTRDVDPAIYSQGRPFKHKLREEDEEEATRKPTFN
jgi:hypothetical protein